MSYEEKHLKVIVLGMAACAMVSLMRLVCYHSHDGPILK